MSALSINHNEHFAWELKVCNQRDALVTGLIKCSVQNKNETDLEVEDEQNHAAHLQYPVQTKVINDKNNTPYRNLAFKGNNTQKTVVLPVHRYP